jgi:hypothetical protein
MKANELRIGNLIQSRENRIFEVTLEDLQFIEAGSLCKPITLTEEWLLKFDKIDWISKDIKGVFFWFNGEKKYIKFVHSLQNTYFCIEQKELLCVNT